MKTIRYYRETTHDTCGGWRWLARYGNGSSEWSVNRADALRFDAVTAGAVAAMLETIMFDSDGGRGRSAVETVDA